MPNALDVRSRFVLMTWLAQALCVLPGVITAERFGLDVIDFSSGSHKALGSAVTAKRFIM